MRTNETSFYSAPGAEEYSAMASAEGAVQQMEYKSTFPLLINLNNKPTYLVSLKDAAGLVKMYGFVDVSDYQKVVVTDSSKGIEQAAKNYLGKDFTEQDDTKLTEKEITIKSIKTATIFLIIFLRNPFPQNVIFKTLSKTEISILYIVLTQLSLFFSSVQKDLKSCTPKRYIEASFILSTSKLTQSWYT